MISIRWSMIDDEFKVNRIRVCDVPAEIKKDMSEIAVTAGKACRIIRGEYWIADVTFINDTTSKHKHK